MSSAKGGRTPSAKGWMRPAIGAALMIVLSYIAFVFVPNTLLGYLSTRVVPTWRDLIVVACWAMGFMVCCWVFVRLQRGRA